MHRIGVISMKRTDMKVKIKVIGEWKFCHQSLTLRLSFTTDSDQTTMNSTERLKTTAMCDAAGHMTDGTWL